MKALENMERMLYEDDFFVLVIHLVFFKRKRFEKQRCSGLSESNYNLRTESWHETFKF